MENLFKLLNHMNEIKSDLESLDIDQINEIIELRDDLIAELEKTELTVEQKKQLQTLATYDQKVVARMEQLKKEATNELIKINKTRKQQEGYISQYEAESYFIDDKK